MVDMTLDMDDGVVRNLDDAPAHLTTEAQNLFLDYVDQYETTRSAYGHTILTTAMEAYVRMRQAQLLLKDGIMITDNNGKLLQHPAIRIEAQSRAAMLAGLKQLNIDVIPTRDKAGRPPNASQPGLF
jgi:P27 family predicted phage terminase small subunit